jgi:asparagine synthase (glutamine-hydrolysing)
VRLALVGEGADELFGGYPTYLGAGIAERYQRLPAWFRKAFRRYVESRPPDEKKVSVLYLLKRFVRGVEMEGVVRHQLWTSNIPPEILARLGVPPSPPRSADSANGGLLDRVQRWDFEGSLAEGLLTKADRASMSSALELRAPFLDEAVMNFAATLPVEERVRGFTTKVFLKRYALRYLPKTIVHRRKRGLSVPLSRWLRGPLRDWAEAALSNEQLGCVGIRNAVALELLSEHCRRDAEHGRTIWTLITLSEWLDWSTKETGDVSMKG